MSVNTRSHSKKVSFNNIEIESINNNINIPRNSKGYPSVGQLRPKSVPKYKENKYISKCVCLSSTIHTFIQASNEYFEECEYVAERNKIDVSDLEKPHLDIFKKIFDYVSIDMRLTYNINAMFTLCTFLIETNMWEQYEEFIMNCPKKFMIACFNNSERTPNVLLALKNVHLYRVSKYIVGFVDKSKLRTWNETRNMHL
jgi:hypothetical protein